MRKLTGYRFLDRDPILDIYYRAKQLSGAENREIVKKSGVTAGTLRNWSNGKTRQPRHLTISFALHACGFEEVYESKDGKRLRFSYGKKL